MKKNKISEYCIKAGVSQAQLAAILGVSYQQIQKWGKSERIPSVYNAVRIARALNATVEEVFPLNDEQD